MPILKKNAANIISLTRIISTLVMIFMPVFSKGFFVTYTYAGISDIADGFVARKFNLVSKLGAKLDSISDLFFYTVMMIKILPSLIFYLPGFMMITIYSVAGVRLVIYLYVGLSKRKFISNHTIWNKATGFTLFFVPYFIRAKYFVYYAGLVILIAIIAAVYEIRLIATKEE